MGLGAQITAYVLCMALIGYGLDEWQETPRRYYTAGFALLGVIFAIVHLIRSTRSGRL
ncbi:MAG: AtpZ/AtpI family protein [Bacteroidetes bacterium]|nr:AtpZ/AtpI family protein [Bacteroidota bacterium]